MDALIRRRSVIKGLLTRIEKYSATLNDESCEDEVKERARRAKELLQNFSDIEDQICNENPTERSENEEFEEQYYRVIAKLNKWLRLKTLSPTNQMNQMNDSIMNYTTQANNSDFKLPRVNIPSFSGDYREWQSFFDLFNTMVHENQSLSAVRKFQYLKGLLNGEASNLLKHLSVTEANYIEAFQKLCKRYDRKGLIANTFIKLFMEQPNIRQANASNIRKVLDTSDESTRGLKALGNEAESKDPWLLYVLFNKLDDETKQLWMRHTSDQEFPSIQNFYDFLASRADALEGVNLTNKGHSSKPAVSVKGFYVKAADFTCPVCQNNHHQLFECTIFKSMDVEARRDLIKTDGRCFNCLNNNHRVYNCRSPKRFRTCSKRHHSLLHSAIPQEEGTEKTSATSNLLPPENAERQSQSSTLSLASNQQQDDSISTHNVNVNDTQSVSNQTLLPTAIIKIKDDSGSQVSFVSENLVQRLNLSRTNARIRISGIGQATAGTTKGKVTICISSRIEQTNLQVECLIIPKITSYQPATLIRKPILHDLEHLPLADPTFNQPNKIDVLLGSDQFFGLLKAGIISLNSNGLTAQNTVFGWVIAGAFCATNQNSPILDSLHCEVNVDKLLQRFWELEEITPSGYSTNYSKEEKKAKPSATVLAAVTNNTNVILQYLISKFSSSHKIIRVLALVYKYLDILSDRLKPNPRNLRESMLTVDELTRSQTKIFTWVQNEYFATEITEIKSKRQLPKKSKIRSLNPFIDDQNLLRVGGRIENAAADYATKHPVILPNCELSKLFIRDLHEKHHHAGASLLISIIRQHYHIINCSKLVKDVIKRCNRCQRFNTKPNYQIMGNLPIDRVRYESPFLKTGIDYAGPLQLKQIYGRSTQRWKAYVAIFVCMATKAVHIEVVSNLTTENFIATLQRFVSRRGLCSDIYSDNGSNFIGANNELRETYEFLKTNSNHIFSFLASEHIKWHFIPSVAPTFGGLWEAAVKSFKYHLKRIMGNTVFTFEELTTISSQIEAVLNSRPLCVLSDDHMDALTPGHLLIGRPIVQIPQPPLTETKLSHISRWQHKQQITQHFCNRWKMEYLNSLHKRNKWQIPGESYKIGDIVIIREENLPPTKWLLGRIEEVHRGRDGTTRVVTMKTKTGYLKRPVHKLTKLTTNEVNQQIHGEGDVVDQSATIINHLTKN